jgi:hypothetical protein
MFETSKCKFVILNVVKNLLLYTTKACFSCVEDPSLSLRMTIIGVNPTLMNYLVKRNLLPCTLSTNLSLSHTTLPETSVVTIFDRKIVPSNGLHLHL